MSRRLAGLWMILLAVTVSACGAPQFTYVANSDAHTYFKVPGQWHKITDSALASQLHRGSGSAQQTGFWSVGYDGSNPPSATHVFDSGAPQPFAFALVEKLSPTASSVMSYNGLRDLFLPVTPATRLAAAKSGFALTGFRLLRDTVLTPGQGVHGVRVTFEYTFPDGNTDTFDQVAFTNADDTEVYLLVLHCLAICYRQHYSEIDTVMKSFTVRSN
jgi:hypothetical protein